MKNKLTDLNDHLFAQLERLSDEHLVGDQLETELRRSRAVANVAREIIHNAKTVLRSREMYRDALYGDKPPAMLAIEHDASGGSGGK